MSLLAPGPPAPPLVEVAFPPTPPAPPPPAATQTLPTCPFPPVLPCDGDVDGVFPEAPVLKVMYPALDWVPRPVPPPPEPPLYGFKVAE